MADEIKLPLGNVKLGDDVDDPTLPDLNDPNNEGNPNTPDNTADEVVTVVIEDNEYTLDDEGNALDADGEIVFKADELDISDDTAGDNDKPTDDLEDDVIEIDGVEYSIDEEGNAINDKGEVGFTAEQLKEFEDVTNVTTTSNLIELSRIVPADIEGNPIEYSDDADGQRKYIEDVYEAGGLDKAQAIIDDYYSQNPLIKVATDYITANGSLDGFNEAEYKPVELTDKSTDAEIINVIRQARKMKGDTEQEIAQAITWATNDGKLLDVGKTSQTYIEAQESSKREQLAVQATAKRQARVAKNEEYINNLNNKINESGKLTIQGRTLNIPKILEINEDGRKRTVDRSALLAYATEVHEWDIDGERKFATQYQIDKMEALSTKSIDDDIYNMLKLFTKQNDGMLLQSAINNQKANSVRMKLRTKQSNNTTKHNRPSNGQPRLKLKYNS